MKCSSRITASEVVEKAGVSRWTVSRAFTPGKPISEDVKKRVRSAAKELGYKPNLLARSLSTKRTGLVAVVVDHFENQNVIKVLGKLTSALQKQGLRVLLINVTHGDNVSEFVELADQHQADGVIFLGATLTEDFISTAREITRIPLVVAFRDCYLDEPLVINTNDTKAGEQIADLCIKEGAKTFAYLSSPQNTSTYLKRKDAYEARLKECGFTLDRHIEIGRYDQFLASEIFGRYLDKTPIVERVDAVFCENDTIAFGVIDALKLKGGYAQMSVVGFDNVPFGASSAY
ncbi:LacI family DNA-binding transcriptional regulator [Marinomonas mediterranea]|nr:LacI family DNA-binding transcriptional regulator [Marinomonas mediterranea]WCN12237.1 LacI family DNA-binding transcriptional regulator [Marinomonas mediterranea]